jgi:putative hydrolase of the HAD superfamily
MKPHLAIFEYALNKVNTSASTSIMVGDTLEVDILGAINAGMDTIYFNPAQPPTEKIKPTHVVQNLGEVIRLF